MWTRSFQRTQATSEKTDPWSFLIPELPWFWWTDLRLPDLFCFCSFFVCAHCAVIVSTFLFGSLWLIQLKCRSGLMPSHEWVDNPTIRQHGHVEKTSDSYFTESRMIHPPDSKKYACSYPTVSYDAQVLPCTNVLRIYHSAKTLWYTQVVVL